MTGYFGWVVIGYIVAFWRHRGTVWFAADMTWISLAIGAACAVEHRWFAVGLYLIMAVVWALAGFLHSESAEPDRD